MPRPNPIPLFACVLASLVVAGCGPDAKRQAEPQEPAGRTATTVAEPPAAARTDHCRLAVGAGTQVPLSDAASTLGQAVTSATAAPGRFRIRAASRPLAVPLAPGPLEADALLAAVPARLVGSGTRNGERSQLRWRGGALRVGPDGILLRRPDEPWRRVGPDGGLHVDLGRELAAHAHLLQVRAARRADDGSLVVVSRVRAKDLRSYAREEHPEIEQVLAAAGDLELRSVITADGRLASDELAVPLAGRFSQRCVRVATTYVS